MKPMTRILAILSITAICATSALAAEGGNPKKGKYLYKKDCKTCHVAGGEGGEMTPLSKTQAQWDRFFDKKSKGCADHAGVSETDVKDIQQFLFDHAADSDQPETCG
jgi:cytochrome c5